MRSSTERILFIKIQVISANVVMKAFRDEERMKGAKFGIDPIHAGSSGCEDHPLSCDESDGESELDTQRPTTNAKKRKRGRTVKEKGTTDLSAQWKKYELDCLSKGLNLENCQKECRRSSDFFQAWQANESVLFVSYICGMLRDIQSK